MLLLSFPTRRSSDLGDRLAYALPHLLSLERFANSVVTVDLPHHGVELEPVREGFGCIVGMKAKHTQSCLRGICRQCSQPRPPAPLTVGCKTGTVPPRCRHGGQIG